MCPVESFVSLWDVELFIFVIPQRERDCLHLNETWCIVSLIQIRSLKISKLYRLFHSILNLRQVLQSSAHWLLLMDKKKYYNDQSKPFLLMVLIQTMSSLITDTQFTAIFECQWV